MIVVDVDGDIELGWFKDTYIIRLSGVEKNTSKTAVVAIKLPLFSFVLISSPLQPKLGVFTASIHKIQLPMYHALLIVSCAIFL